jgi:curved DNA-binding protein CbpA
MRFEAEFLNHDLHALLGVPGGATSEQIRSAYRLKARNSHPDLNPQDPDAGRRMALLNRAVRVLLDPVLRGDYERARRASLRAQPGHAAEASRSWFECPDLGDLDWRGPETRPAPPATPGQRAFRRRVRHSGANLASRAQEALRKVGNEQRLVLAALCIALGSGLLVFARPSNAFWSGSATAQIGASEP